MDSGYVHDLAYFDYLLPKIDKDIFCTDAHIHTSLSDGIETFDVTCRRIKESNIELFSITDHNRFSQANMEIDELYSTQKPFVFGCEFSCCYENVRVHILGYYFRPFNSESLSIIQRIHEGHNKREEIRIANMRQAEDIKLTYEYFRSKNEGKVPNWRRTAQALVDCGDAMTVEEASEHFLRPGKCGYLSYSDNWPKVDAVDAVKAICCDGGIPVLAHLGDLQKQLGEERTESLISNLQAVGLVGYDVSAGGKHLAVPMGLQLLCQETYKLLPVYGSDCHDAVFDSQYKATRTSVEWLKKMLLAYSTKELSSFLDYSISDILHAFLTPNFDVCSFPFGFLDDLHKDSISSFRDLLYSSKSDNYSIQLTIVLIINCLSFRCAEYKICELFRNFAFRFTESRDKGVSSLKSYVVSLYNSYLHKSNAKMLSENELLFALRIWVPVLYRLNFYDEASILLNSCMSCFGSRPYISFCEMFETAKETHKVYLVESSFESMLNSIIDQHDEQVEDLLYRRVKSLASCYQKYVMCHLNRSNIKMPNWRSEKDVGLLSIFEDLLAATIITKVKFSRDMVEIPISSSGIDYAVKFVSDSSRRWYHQRLIYLFDIDCITSELLVKTNYEFWFAFYFYWRTKNILVYDYSPSELKPFVLSYTVDNARIIDFCISDLFKQITETNQYEGGLLNHG